MAIVFGRMAEVAVLLECKGNIDISCRRLGSTFEFGGKEIFCAALSGGLKVLAVAGSIVEPFVSGELAIAATPVFQPLPDGLISQRLLERGMRLLRRVVEVQPCERIIGGAPYRRLRASTCIDHLAGELDAGAVQNKLEAFIAKSIIAFCPLHQGLRTACQQEFEIMPALLTA